ncbi:MAG: Trk system potassium transporter TrkA [Pseudomonadota bacterium]
MKIIILGGNRVGGALAENLAHENHDITVVDISSNCLNELKHRFDIQTIYGSGSHPDILEAANAADADLLIAVTDNDEVNLVACQAAYSLFNVPTKIARIRATQYMNYPALFGSQHLPVDVFISPEELITDRVKQLIEHPGTLQVLNFSNGQVKLVAVKPVYGGPLVNKTVAEIHDFVDVETRIVAIYHGGHPIVPNDDTIIQVGDEVFFLAASNDINKTLTALGRSEQRYRSVVIAGGGNIGLRLAKALEKDYQVKVIDRNKKCTDRIAAELDHATVLHGDTSDREMLINENIENADVFVAVTNDDENNIMSCMLSKRLGVRRVMALITHTAYVDLIEGSDIDIAISPQQATISAILRYVRRGDIVNVYSLRRGAAEAIEIISHGDKNSSKIVGRTVKEIKLPPGSIIGAVTRGDEVIMAYDELMIEPDDHVILFVVNKKHTQEIEKLFQVNLGFFSLLKN